jgi:hypothetical protein
MQFLANLIVVLGLFAPLVITGGLIFVLLDSLWEEYS